MVTVLLTSNLCLSLRLSSACLSLHDCLSNRREMSFPPNPPPPPPPPPLLLGDTPPSSAGGARISSRVEPSSLFCFSPSDSAAEPEKSYHVLLLKGHWCMYSSYVKLKSLLTFLCACRQDPPGNYYHDVDRRFLDNLDGLVVFQTKDLRTVHLRNGTETSRPRHTHKHYAIPAEFRLLPSGLLVPSLALLSLE